MLLSAQTGNGVTVSNLAMDAGTVTLNVSWKNTGMPALWSDSVWVFVDYNNNGKMERLPLLSGATLTATSAPGSATVIQYDDNDKGVWVVGNARSAGSFSATVQLLTGTGGSQSRPLHGACVYASNDPPVGEYTSATQFVFTGTPPYDIVLKNKDNAKIYRTSGADFDIPGGYTFVSFTDATGAPGSIVEPILDHCPLLTAGKISVTFWTRTGVCPDMSAGKIRAGEVTIDNEHDING
jgi:hypothetical protein